MRFLQPENEDFPDFFLYFLRMGAMFNAFPADCGGSLIRNAVGRQMRCSRLKKTFFDGFRLEKPGMNAGQCRGGKKLLFKEKMAAAAGVEPATCSLGESRSIQLSYATAFRVLFQSWKIYYNPVFAKIKRKKRRNRSFARSGRMERKSRSMRKYAAAGKRPYFCERETSPSESDMRHLSGYFKPTRQRLNVFEKE